MEFVPGLLVGLLGSFHCLGMCGPLILAIPHRTENKSRIIIEDLFYNIGRISIYVLLGIFLGLIGLGLGFGYYQQYLSIGMGVLILILYFLPGKIKNRFSNFGLSRWISGNFRKYFNFLLQSKNLFSLITLGMLNGLLPCGLVYVALAGAFAYGDTYKTILFMLGFGVGTVPIMFALFIAKDLITLKIRKKITKLIPAGVIIIALMLILRGSR